MGSWAIFMILRTLVTGNLHLFGDLLGGRLAPQLLDELALGAGELLIVSIMCTGMRMVRAWSAIARVIA